MPSWCSNRLLTTGNEQQLVLFQKSVQHTRVHEDGAVETLAISFERLEPVPQELYTVVAGRMSDPKAQQANERLAAEMTTRYGCPDWYAYRIAHWGTKCDADNPSAHWDGSALVYTFETAWSPPLPVIQAASAQYPDLTFAMDYGEPFGGYRGRTVFRAGEMLEHMCEDWNPFGEDEESDLAKD